MRRPQPAGLIVSNGLFIECSRCGKRDAGDDLDDKTVFTRLLRGRGWEWNEEWWWHCQDCVAALKAEADLEASEA